MTCATGTARPVARSLRASAAFSRPDLARVAARVGALGRSTHHGDKHPCTFARCSSRSFPRARRARGVRLRPLRGGVAGAARQVQQAPEREQQRRKRSSTQKDLDDAKAKVDALDEGARVRGRRHQQAEPEPRRDEVDARRARESARRVQGARRASSSASRRASRRSAASSTSSPSSASPSTSATTAWSSRSPATCSSTAGATP